MKKENKWIGYCTNVHAGFDLDVTKANLEKYALSVKQKCSPDKEMGIGLWLSANAVGEMIRQNQVREFAGWLETNQLVPFTFNGFPHGNFHQDVVKHLVYLPTWADDSRREYSEQLADVIDQLLPPGMEGSISTLPLAWQDEKVDDEFLRQSAKQLILLARHLEELEKSRNRLVYFCIEPEPGCVMQTSQTCVDFFQKYLFGQSSQVDDLVRRYIRVCHDVCHSAVMFEEQSEFIRNIYDAGIKIGKVQVSSAVHMNLHAMSEGQRMAAMEQLRDFKEPRYLHQTVLQTSDDKLEFYEDLPLAMERLDADISRYSEARVHFHVPIFLKRFGELETSQTEILQCLEATQSIDDLLHFEAETYAWGVLPEELRCSDDDENGLAAGISDEIQWLANLA